MSRGIAGLALGLVLGSGSAALAGLPSTPIGRCNADAVPAGTVCLDTYEASVWRVPDPTGRNATLVRKITRGRATAADLARGGAVQLGVTGDDYAPCTDDGQRCMEDVFAVSLPSVQPSAYVTWFQAQAACANAGKRLPSSAEWQVGANGTPDSGPDDGVADCATDGALVARTGARRRCVSARGAFDMTGNLTEWVADWLPHPAQCQIWGHGLSNDLMCLAGARTPPGLPGAVVRGGYYFFFGEFAGPLTVAAEEPTNGFHYIGFRCAR
jgi:hypothetical protein